MLEPDLHNAGRLPAGVTTSAAIVDPGRSWMCHLQQHARRQHALLLAVAAALVVTAGASVSAYLSIAGVTLCESAGCHTLCAEVRFYPLSVQPRSLLTTLDGEPHGIRREWHPGGGLWLAGRYEHGLRSGVWQERYRDGTLRFIGRYHADRLHGPERWYYPNGRLEWQVMRVHGERVGVERWWHPHGELRRIGAYGTEGRAYGERHGLFISFDEQGAPHGFDAYWQGRRIAWGPAH